MKEELEKSGYQVVGDPNMVFVPLEKYCKRKKLDSDWLYDWMWMYTHRQSGVHYYKNVMTRYYLVLTQEGMNLDSISDRILTWFPPRRITSSWARWIHVVERRRVKHAGSQMYEFMSDESLRAVREAAFRNAERALERGFDRIYEDAMKRVYEIEEVLMGRRRA